MSNWTLLKDDYPSLDYLVDVRFPGGAVSVAIWTRYFGGPERRWLRADGMKYYTREECPYEAWRYRSK